MSSKKPAQIPAWQKPGPPKPDDASDTHPPNVKAPPHPATTDSEQQPQGTEEPESVEEADREVLRAEELVKMFPESDSMSPEPTRQEAQKFLEHPGVREASLEDKVRFLEVKKVRRSIIEELLPEAKQIFGPPPTSSASPQSPVSAPSNTPSPPIITYPEFLVKSRRPPPLITRSIILDALYATAATTTGIWALSKYVVTPMQHALAEARHDFLGHAAGKLTALNSNLEGMVSTVPKRKPSASPQSPDADDAASDISTHSDPTELFHRDHGTQTSPPLSRRASVSSSSSSSLPSTSAERTNLAETQLRSLAVSLRELKDSRSGSATVETEVTEAVTGLVHELNDKIYTSKYVNFPTSQSLGAEADSIAKMKTEIRSVKGVLLSTRNFPRGTGW